ncbi:unnamed protein product [Meganyctiphanes norvegica]|uniref:Chitin-binding type-2 domain-containing protein n=1 Tax=Meganyctiphanes norvegica TaxID=48144 RepID=A0AAV2PHL7_MEGNR
MWNQLYLALNMVVSMLATLDATPSACLSMKCVYDEGAFACNKDFCIADYFTCTGHGAEPQFHTCPSGMLFNTIKEYPCCVDMDICPAHDVDACLKTTPAPQTTETPTETTTEGCHLHKECLEQGHNYYPMCTYCDKKYIFCSDIGSPPMVETCEENQVFNTDSSYRLCVDYEECPKHVDLNLDYITAK